MNSFSVIQFLFTCIYISYIPASGTDTDSLNQDVPSTTSLSPPEKANKIASQILTDIFDLRHEQLIESVKTAHLDGMRDNVINTQKEKIAQYEKLNNLESLKETDLESLRAWRDTSVEEQTTKVKELQRLTETDQSTLDTETKILDKLKSLPETDGEELKRGLTDNQNRKIIETNEKNGWTNLNKKEEGLELTKLKKLEDFSIEAYRKSVLDKILRQEGTDTIAMRIVGDQVFLAGNIKTRKLPLEINNPELFILLSDSRKIIDFDYEDFGFTNNDARAIDKSLKNSNIRDLTNGQPPRVSVLQPVQNNFIEADLISKYNAEMDKLAKTRDDKLTNAELTYTEDSSELLKVQKTTNEEYHSKVAEVETKLDTDTKAAIKQATLVSKFNTAINELAETRDDKLKAAERKNTMKSQEFLKAKSNIDKYDSKIAKVAMKIKEQEDLISKSKAKVKKLTDIRDAKLNNAVKTNAKKPSDLLQAQNIFNEEYNSKVAEVKMELKAQEDLISKSKAEIKKLTETRNNQLTIAENKKAEKSPELLEAQKTINAEYDSEHAELRKKLSADTKAAVAQKGLISKSKARIDKLTDARDANLKYASKVNAMESPELLQAQKIINEEYNSKVAKAEMKLNVDTNAIYHAEMVLIKHDTGGTENSILGVSKRLCIDCVEHVKDHKHNDKTLFDFAQHKGEDKTVTNWSPLAKFTKMELEDMLKNANPISSADTPPLSDLSCTSGRRRRSTKSCIFHRKPNNKEVDIDSQAFLEEYNKSPPEVKNQLASEAAKSSNAKLLGGDLEVEKVRKIIEHEKMKVHEGKVISTRTSLETGDFDGLSQDVKISPTKTRIVLSKKFSKYVKNAGKVSGHLGKFLLGKGIVQGLAKGDTTGLAIMGGRIVGEAGLEYLGKFGGKIAGKVAEKTGTKLGIKATAKLASKGFGALAKAAGPIGSVADVGMSIWGLTKAVQRLDDPHATKWEQNDAIADIVGESLDISVTAVTTIASIAFPPLAPLLAVAGFFTSLIVTASVAVYQAQNHVDSLNSKIPLLDYEKTREFGRNLISQDTSEYLLNLIKVKNANNLAVNESIRFLEENSDVIGHVYPSKMIELKGGCRLIGKICNFGTWFGICIEWDDPTTLAYNCYKDGKCLDKDILCTDMTATILSRPRYSHSCVCSSEPETKFGQPEPNSVVDFRKKQWSYKDRAVPDPPYDNSYEYLCVPSSLNSKGDKVSFIGVDYGYLCEHAIGMQRKSKSGKYIFYELGDGTDSIYLNLEDKTSSRFHVGNGDKNFHGGGGADLFAITGNCSNLHGTLDGEGGDGNALAVGSQCRGNNDKIKIDLEGRKMTGPNINVNLRNLENIYGRKGAADVIIASCSTKFISGDGGSSSVFSDEVSLPQTSNCRDGSNITIVAGSWTKIYTGGTSRMNALVSVPKGASEVTFTHKTGGKTTLWIAHAASDLISVTSNQAIVKLRMESGETLSFTKMTGLDIFLQENYGVSSLNFNDEGFFQCSHKLESGGDGRRWERRGCRSLPNLFDLSSGSWSVKGGANDDSFLLSGRTFSGSISGGKGFDKLYLSPSLFSGEAIFANLLDGKLYNIGNTSRISVESIEEFHGRRGETEKVSPSCTSSLIKCNGGFSVESPDEIHISNLKCARFSLTLPIEGLTSIFSEMKVGKITVLVLPENFSNTKLDVDLSSEIQIGIQFPFASSSMKKIEVTGDKITLQYLQQHIFELLLRSNLSDQEEFHTNLGFFFKEDYNLPSSLLVRKGIQGFLAFHKLTCNQREPHFERAGNSFMPNYFLVDGCSSSLIGGDEDDVFEISGKNPSASEVNGGKGINDLRISMENTPVLINLVEDFWTIRSTGDRKSISEIQRIFGSEGNPEVVVVGCDTSLVSLEGGSLEKPDFIMFTPVTNCSSVLTTSVVAKGHTTVESFAPIHLSIQVVPLAGALQFTAEYKLSSSTNIFIFLHLLPQQLASYEVQIGTNRNYVFNFGTQATVNLIFYSDETTKAGKYIENQEILFVNLNSSTKSFILMERAGEVPLVVHEVGKYRKESTSVYGSPGAPNHFSVFGCSNGCEAIGGNKENTFQLLSTSFSGSLVGGNGNLNTLFLDLATSESGNNLIVDLNNGIINGQGTVRNIQKYVGKREQTETIIVGCDTQFVNSGGGSSQNSDNILIPANLNCRSLHKTIVLVHPHSKVENNASIGSFNYVISKEEHFQIHTSAVGQASHSYQFGFGLSKLHSAKFNGTHISIFCKSQRKFDFLMNSLVSSTPSTFFHNPSLVFTDDKSRVDFHVMQQSGSIVANILISKSTDLVEGLGGVVNVIEIDSEQGIFQEIRGTGNNDSFKIRAAKFSKSIHSPNGTKGSLELLPTFHPKNKLIVDLRTMKVIAEENNNNSIEVIEKLDGIQIIKGRGKDADDTIYANCDTLLVANFPNVFFTHSDCPNKRNVVLELGSTTAVKFQIPESKRLSSVFSNGVFHYNFQNPRSFDIQVDFWLDIRQTQHIFHLPFNLDDMEEVYFDEDESSLTYSIQGAPYSHSIDTYIPYDEGFYSQPKFHTKDKFQIKITRENEILLTTGTVDWSPAEDDVKALAYSEAASRLSVTFLAEGASTFLYVGNKDTTNVLTNTEKRSILCGEGGASTTYVILNLLKDTKIYPGFHLSEYQNTHTLDLTQIIFEIQNSSADQTKYVPTITQSSEDLVIHMEEWEDAFPGKIILVNGTNYFQQIDVILDASVMKIKSTSSGLQIQRRKRGALPDQPEIRYFLKPVPLIVSQNQVTIMGLEDFEFGQEVIFSENLNKDNQTLKAYRNGKDLVLSNIEDIGDMQELTSLILLETYEVDGTVVKLDQELAESISILEKEGEEMNASTIWSAAKEAEDNSQVKDWEDVLEEVEYKLLQDLPEVPKSFEIPLHKKVWKRYKNWALCGFIFLILLLLFLIFLVINRAFLNWQYKLIVQKKDSAVKEFCEESDIMLKTFSKGIIDK